MFPSLEAKKYAYSLIGDGKNEITKLDEEEKMEFAALLIESRNKFNAWDYISETHESLELPYQLAQYMKSRSPRDAQEIIKLLVQGAVKSAGNEMVDTLLSQQEEFEFDKENNFN